MKGRGGTALTGAFFYEGLPSVCFGQDDVPIRCRKRWTALLNYIK